MGSGPTRNRTENLLIKSQLLCQLSYRPKQKKDVQQLRHAEHRQVKTSRGTVVVVVHAFA